MELKVTNFAIKLAKQLNSSLPTEITYASTTLDEKFNSANQTSIRLLVWEKRVK